MSTESELDELSTEPVQVDPEPDRAAPDRSEAIGPDRAKADPEAPLNLVPLALGAVSATTIAAAGVFTAYGTTGLIVGGVAAGAGLLSVTPARSRRPRSALGRLAAGVSRRSGRSGSGRPGSGLFGSGRSGSGRSGSGRTGSVGALSRRARSGASAGRDPGRAGSVLGRSGPGLFGSGRSGSGSGFGPSRSGSGRTGSAVRAGRSGSGSGFGPSRSGSGRSGSGRTGSGLFGSTSRSGRTGRTRAGRTGSGSGLFGRSSTTGRRGSGSALGGLLGAKARRSHGRLSATGPGGLPPRRSGTRTGLWPWRRRTKDTTSGGTAAGTGEGLPERKRRRLLARAYAYTVPMGIRKWVHRRWIALSHPAGWVERLRDPIWRYRRGHLKPWERKAALFLAGCWDAVAKVFEAGDVKKTSHREKAYGSLPRWERLLVALTLGSWVWISSGFRRPLPDFRIPDRIEEPAAPAGGENTFTDWNPMSAEEKELIETAEAFADALSKYGREMPMMKFGNGLCSVAPSLAKIAEGVFDMANRMRDEDPIDPAFTEAVDLVGDSILNAAKVSEELPVSFSLHHHVELERLHNPRAGEERWDVRAQDD